MIVSSDKRRSALRLPTLTEITTEWPATVDIAEAGAAFGLSRSYAYELVARGEFPAKVIRVGSRHRVITASIIHALSDETAT